MREDWIECKIGDVTFKSNKTSREKEFSEDIFEYIDISTVDNSLFKLKETKLLSWNDAPSRAQQIVDINDVLFSTVRPYLKNIAFVSSDSNNRRIASTGFCVLKPHNIILPKFLFYYVCNDRTINAISKYQTGTSYPAVRDSDIFSINFPLPPLPEQRAIVKKLESLFSSLDAGVTDLKKAQQQLKIYRQAVLKKAFDGEMNSKKLGEIAEITSSRRIFKAEYVTSGIPFYRTKEIKELSQGLKPAVELFIPISRYEEIKKNNDLPKTNDILISAVGTIGVSYVIRDNEPFYFKDGNLVWIKNPQINSYFLHYFFENKVRFSNSIDTSGSAYNALTIEKLKNFNITFPENITEQELIVKQIESRLSVCDSIEQNIKESLVKAEALRQSILKKAFEGKLLTAQELAECKLAENYEHASVLLERIKAEQKGKTVRKMMEN